MLVLLFTLTVDFFPPSFCLASVPIFLLCVVHLLPIWVKFCEMFHQCWLPLLSRCTVLHSRAYFWLICPHHWIQFNDKQRCYTQVQLGKSECVTWILWGPEEDSEMSSHVKLFIKKLHNVWFLDLCLHLNKGTNIQYCAKASRQPSFLYVLLSRSQSFLLTLLMLGLHCAICGSFWDDFSVSEFRLHPESCIV